MDNRLEAAVALYAEHFGAEQYIPPRMAGRQLVQQFRENGRAPNTMTFKNTIFYEMARSPYWLTVTQEATYCQVPRDKWHCLLASQLYLENGVGSCVFRHVAYIATEENGWWSITKYDCRDPIAKLTSAIDDHVDASLFIGHKFKFVPLTWARTTEGRRPGGPNPAIGTHKQQKERITSLVYKNTLFTNPTTIKTIIATALPSEISEMVIVKRKKAEPRVNAGRGDPHWYYK